MPELPLPRSSSSSDVFSRRVEAAVPEALDFLPEDWAMCDPSDASRERTARALVERVLAAADRAVPMVEVADIERALDWAKAPVGDEHVDCYTIAGRIRALYSRERIAANQQRGRAEKGRGRACPPASGRGDPSSG